MITAQEARAGTRTPERQAESVLEFVNHRVEKQMDVGNYVVLYRFSDSDSARVRDLVTQRLIALGYTVRTDSRQSDSIQIAWGGK